MSQPTGILVQGTTTWNASGVTEISYTGGLGDLVVNLSADINLSFNSGLQGPQTDNSWAKAYPVLVSSNSYEFVYGLVVVTPGTVGFSTLTLTINNYSPPSGVKVYVGSVAGAGFTVPVATNSIIATTEMATGATYSIVVPANTIRAISGCIYLQVRCDNTVITQDFANIFSVTLSAT